MKTEDLQARREALGHTLWELERLRARCEDRGGRKVLRRALVELTAELQGVLDELGRREPR